MYQIFEKSALFNFILFWSTGIGFLIWYIMNPSDITSWIRMIFSTISISVLSLGLVGGTGFWRLLWRVFTPLNRWVFPDLNGNWKIEMKSNIKAIARYHPVLKGKHPKSSISGTVSIKQSLFSMNMVFQEENSYSNSETLLLRPIKTKESGRFKLAYIYENDSPDPKKTDEQRHFGAGIAEIFIESKKMRITGLYWTNRNWTQGLNTAGKLEMTKLT